jgi:HD-GYP domain-containing protein (c-di-GMP phosphodiesterase class II)
MENIFREEGIDIAIRIGFRRLTNADFTGNFEKVLPWYFQKLQGQPAPVCSLDGLGAPANLVLSGQQETMSDFEKDIDEKNKKLLELIEQLKKEQHQREEAYFELLGSLVNALEAKDEYTKGHSQRVSNYAVMLAHKLNLSEEELDTIRKAGTMHDVGKIGLPDNILHKRGKLTEQEYEIVRRHARIGANIIEPIHYFRKMLPCILYHHEHYDGTGYPRGLKGSEIPLGAQIMAVADVYDALTTARDYKPGCSPEEAVRELRRVAGSQLNPRLIDSFVQMLSEKGILRDAPGK